MTATVTAAHVIRQGFDRAGLKIQVLQKPLRAFNEDQFQIDINRKFSKKHKSTRGEVFRVWPGIANITIMSTDKSLRQLTLLVKEEGELTTVWDVYVSGNTHRTHRMDHNPTVKEKNLICKEQFCEKSSIQVQRRQTKVGGGTRKFLMGVDERQLFIAQFIKGTSVKDAHVSLKPTTLTLADGPTGKGTKRQGEWFFLPLNEERQKSLERVLADEPHLIHKGEPIGPGGNPHKAAEIVRTIPEAYRLKHGFSVRPQEVFVRGRVTHSDHAPLKLGRKWFHVIRNNEVGAEASGAFTGPGGVFWLD